MEKEIHAFEAARISKEHARLNYVMDEIFGIIKNNAKLGMFYANIVGSPFSNLNEIEQSICIKRLEALSYKVEKTTVGINIKWEK